MKSFGFKEEDNINGVLLGFVCVEEEKTYSTVLCKCHVITFTKKKNNCGGFLINCGGTLALSWVIHGDSGRVMGLLRLIPGTGFQGFGLL